MKKLSLLLALLLVLTTIISSCTNKSDNSGTSSQDSSSDQSQNDATSEQTDGKLVPEFETNVSNGKKYTPSQPANEVYPDTFGAELTDGIYSATGKDYADPKFCAWNVDNLSIVIDLGEVYDKLYKFEVSYLAMNSAGIAPLSGGSVAYSVDGESYTSLGSIKKPDYIADTVQQASVVTTKYIEARYIKFTLSRGAAWLFLDELSVYADFPDESKNAKFIENILGAYNNDTMTNAQRVDALNSVSKKLVDRSQIKMLASKNKGYTLSRPSTDDAHKDDGKKMTNGNIIGSLYESGNWVSFTGTEMLDITVDLGKSYEDLSDFEISLFNNLNISVSIPDYVTFSVSDDNENFVEIGRAYGPSSRDDYYFNIALKLTYGVKGRYVKFSISESGFTKYFIEEVAVYRYGTEIEAKDNLYPEISLPKITKEEFWSSSVSDYSKKQNLILGRQPQIVSAVPLPSSAAEFNSVVTNPTLTDGKYSTSSDIHNGVFFKFNRGAYREILFDLEKTSTVTSLSASFLIRKEWAVLAPPIVRYYLSDDGVNWYLAGQSTIENTEKVEIVKVGLTLDKPVKTRFVRFAFAVEMWAGCDELEVLGTKKASSSTTALSSLGIKPQNFLSSEYLKPGENVLGGAKDIMLSYHYRYNANEPEAGSTTVEQYLPYVAYIDKDGKMIDVMFDGFLFLPNSGKFPSGGEAHANGTKSDWETVQNNMFRKDYNMDALNQATQIAKDTLKLGKDYKYKVYAALLYPTKELNFGDFDGDGKSDTLATNKQRIDAVKWYIDEFYKKFNAGNYTNLEFAGFYWHHESLSNGLDELELLNGVADYVKQKNTQFFWIPYHLSNGYSRYADYGFDFACMQPNYAFREDTPLSYIEVTAMISKAYGMAVEMETDSKAMSNSEFFKRWMEYLKGGVYYGYMDALHMYYQGGMPGVFYQSATSEDLRLRLIYEYTYDFIKHKLKLNPDKLADINFEAEKNKAYQGTLNSGKNVEITEYRINLSPQHGTVTINPDGTFIYYPNKDFTGTDTFSYEYSEQLDYSEGCKVTITVK